MALYLFVYILQGKTIGFVCVHERLQTLGTLIGWSPIGWIRSQWYVGTLYQ